MMYSSLFFVFLLASPLSAMGILPSGAPLPSGVPSLPPVSPKIPIPNTDGVCECPIIPNLEALDCLLDFISHVKILNKAVKTVNGTTFNEYTLEHLEIIKGALTLPTVVLVPQGPCGLELEANLQYLLSGVLTGESNLYSGLCLQILNGLLSPAWDLVDDGLLHQLGLLDAVQDLVCKLINDVVEPLLGKLLSGGVLPGLDALGGLGGIGVGILGNGGDGLLGLGVLGLL